MGQFIQNINSAYLRAVQKFSNHDSREKVYVFVEGYNDIAFWRAILAKYETKTLAFEINVSVREDLPKGKKVLLNMTESLGDNLIICIDSDFDYLFNGDNPQSKLINESPYIFHTYTYSIENYLCYPPSLRSIAVKATKNDRFVFDFEKFMSEYSRAIYKLFLWYVYSAKTDRVTFFSLNEFRSSVKINFVEVSDNGKSTIEWLKVQCHKREKALKHKNANIAIHVKKLGEALKARGVTPDNVYYYMHGHTLYDSVVSVVLESVCEVLKVLTIEFIRSGSKKGIALSNELSNYKNTLIPAVKVLHDNELFIECPLFQKIDTDICNFIKNRTRRR